MNIGGDSPVIGQQVLEGSHAIQLDRPAHNAVELAYKSYRSQITFTPGAGTNYTPLDNAHGPFRNEDLRRAAWAALDRAAITQLVGGLLVAGVHDFADPPTVLYEPFYEPTIVPTNNSNFGQVNDPQINAAMRQAALVVDPAARYQECANVDKLLVAHAVAIPACFSTEPQIESKDVNVINDLWNVGTWDFAYTSLRNP